MNIAQIATTRKTTKAFDPSRSIAPELIEQLRTLLQYAPSSVNAQPWHYVIASSAAGKERIANTLKGSYSYNAAKVRTASHVLVFCARRDLDETHLASLLAQESADGRFKTPEAEAGQHSGRSFYVGLHREQLKDLDVWVDRQVYLSLGSLLLGAAALGVDACPMEGIDCVALDAELGLAEKGLRSVVMVALGYRGADDFNAGLPKSRLPQKSILTEI